MLTSRADDLPAGAVLAEQRARGPLLRLRVAWRRVELDRELAAGAAPHCSAELVLRAERLLRPRNRRLLASSLERAVEVAGRRGPRPLSAAVQPARGAVRAARPQMLALARALRDRGEVSARGVALSELLLIEGSSPLYVEERRGDLVAALLDALEALAV